MTIGIDISQVVYEGSGVGRFTLGLVNSILRYDNRNSYLFFFSSLRRKLPPRLKHRIEAKGHKVHLFRFPPTFLSLMWNDWHIADINRFIGKVDWFISSDWTEPPAKKMKKATIVHDLVFKRYPETLQTNSIRNILDTQEKRLHRVKEESNIIFTDSQSTKEDLISFYQIKDEKIVVNYPGVEILKPKQIHIDTVLKKHQLTNKQFILSVGKLEPRKNIEKLIEAFQQWNNESIELVVVGAKGWGSQPKKDIDRIKFLGYVNDHELSSLYASALFFIYPSLWEGFGYPVVESMKLGCPVATSNTSSLKELGQGAALLFDPQSTDSISNAIDKLTNDENLRKNLIKKGLEKSKEYSWEKYLEIMTRVLEVGI